MMFYLRKFVQHLLRILARIYLARTNPSIIVVTGTTNRHWIKENVGRLLQKQGLQCRVSRKNFNAELGLPMSVLGLTPDVTLANIFKRWLKVLINGFKIALIGAPLDFFVLEVAIDKPADMKYLIKIVKPKVAIFTTITMIYPENFENLDEIAAEYKELVKVLSDNDLAILNADDYRIYKLKDYTKARIITYGIKNKNADYLADNIVKTTSGQSFVIHLPDMQTKKATVARFGKHHIYATIIQQIINDKLKDICFHQLRKLKIDLT